MGRFSSLSIVNSGLRAAQAGLYVTGHNMANVHTAGFSRQQTIQNDFLYNPNGYNGNGAMKIGLGTDISEIRQIRNKFLDISYRQESAKLGFYKTKYNVGMQIDNILGELESDFKTQTVIQDLWDSIQEVTKNPEAIEVRSEFMQTATAFLEKSQDVYKRLMNEQYNLNKEIKTTVVRVNVLAEKIHQMNSLISKNEVSGDNANDYKDERNLALDELAQLLNIEYFEKNDGRIDVFVEGKELVAGGSVNKLGLRYTSEDYSFVEPVFTNSNKILGYDPSGKNALELFDLIGPVNSYNNNDKGGLKAMLVARGTKPVSYATNPVEPDSTSYPAGASDPQYIIDLRVYKKDKFNIENTFIPKTMQKFDQVFNEIVKLINNAVAPLVDDGTGNMIKDPNAPVGLDGASSHYEIFTRSFRERYDASGNYIEENPNDFYTLYSVRNVKINPELLDPGNHDKIAFSKTGDVGNAEVANSILDLWKSESIVLPNGETVNIDGLYKDFVVATAVETREAISFAQEQEVLLVQTDNKRQEIKGVSLDEEMTNMMIFQHAYNASARMVNVIDSMIDKVINGTGRVGL